MYRHNWFCWNVPAFSFLLLNSSLNHSQRRQDPFRAGRISLRFPWSTSLSYSSSPCCYVLCIAELFHWLNRFILFLIVCRCRPSFPRPSSRQSSKNSCFVAICVRSLQAGSSGVLIPSHSVELVGRVALFGVPSVLDWSISSVYLIESPFGRFACALLWVWLLEWRLGIFPLVNLISSPSLCISLTTYFLFSWSLQMNVWSKVSFSSSTSPWPLRPLWSKRQK